MYNYYFLKYDSYKKSNRKLQYRSDRIFESMELKRLELLPTYRKVLFGTVLSNSPRKFIFSISQIQLLTDIKIA